MRLRGDGSSTARGRPRSEASSAGSAESPYNRRMSKSAIDISVVPSTRPAILGGLTIAIGGAILFSMKAVVAKLLYRYHIDAVTLIGFRMLKSSVALSPCESSAKAITVQTAACVYCPPFSRTPGK